MKWDLREGCDGNLGCLTEYENNKLGVAGLNLGRKLINGESLKRYTDNEYVIREKYTRKN